MKPVFIVRHRALKTLYTQTISDTSVDCVLRFLAMPGSGYIETGWKQAQKNGYEIAEVFISEHLPGLLEALQGCIDELELNEKMAADDGDTDLLDRLEAARIIMGRVK